MFVSLVYGEETTSSMIVHREPFPILPYIVCHCISFSGGRQLKTSQVDKKTLSVKVNKFQDAA